MAENTDAGNLEGGLRQLCDCLEQYNNAVNRDMLQISLGYGVLRGLFGEFPQYAWAASFVEAAIFRGNPRGLLRGAGL